MPPPYDNWPHYLNGICPATRESGFSEPDGQDQYHPGQILDIVWYNGGYFEGQNVTVSFTLQKYRERTDDSYLKWISMLNETTLYSQFEIPPDNHNFETPWLGRVEPCTNMTAVLFRWKIPEDIKYLEGDPNYVISVGNVSGINTSQGVGGTTVDVSISDPFLLTRVDGSQTENNSVDTTTATSDQAAGNMLQTRSLIIGLSIGFGLLALALGIWIWFWRRRKRNKKSISSKTPTSDVTEKGVSKPELSVSRAAPQSHQNNAIKIQEVDANTRTTETDDSSPLSRLHGLRSETDKNRRIERLATESSSSEHQRQPGMDTREDRELKGITPGELKSLGFYIEEQKTLGPLSSMLLHSKAKPV
ncbi:uncharacterized protein B0I36DRAFT_32184 [Microdochium trichocladiopsis]|uniref:Uncharacterized protein n=1 Tax=Microdochium trichocladiopsis TaxID=1682393 RepID=A0A9P8XZM4_9PEZI|nr:uncharacterized protein B0I36DRAFT_32184 [Microdochium trichocladiopsis]KAH7021459.1 hypothetical protein B0I36DRAFT_32184 [Microdochium trichocladiopsis]